MVKTDYTYCNLSHLPVSITSCDHIVVVCLQVSGWSLCQAPKLGWIMVILSVKNQIFEGVDNTQLKHWKIHQNARFYRDLLLQPPATPRKNSIIMKLIKINYKQNKVTSSWKCTATASTWCSTTLRPLESTSKASHITPLCVCLSLS